MYRILGANDQVKERRKQVQRPAYTKPELLATGPNQLWSWDITKLKSVSKWTYFYLYVIIDVFSRYVVGWLVAPSEQKALAKKLIEESCIKQNISPGQLTVHADRGSSMKSNAVAQLLCDLGVVKSHSRPHVSNDNPFSEAQFKTLKYCPEFPSTFGSIQDARAFCKDFFTWYNTCHYHTGIGMMIPEHIHYGAAEAIFQNRSDTLTWVPAKKAHESAQSRVTRDSTAITKNRRVSTDLTGFQRGSEGPIHPPTKGFQAF
jgi:putative transposase